MRILIVHNTLNDSTSVSGVLRHYAYMAKAWQEVGHTVDFLVAKAGWPQLRSLCPQVRLVSSDNLFNASRYLAQTWRYFPAFAYRMAHAHWVQLGAQYDVIYASGQLIMEVYPALVLARRHQAKWAVKVHHILAAQPGRRGWFDKLWLWTERQCVRWIHRQAGLVICSTPIVAADFHALGARLGLPAKPVVEIGYGTDLEALAPKSDRPKVFDVVFLGRLHEHKGVFDLPRFWQEIIRRRPQARLLVIGEGPHRRRTAELMAERGLNSSVRFTGGIGDAEKNGLLAQGRVGVSLSYEEGWGLSVMEFLAAGLPVAGYELPVFASVFPGQLDLVKAGDWGQLAGRVLALLEDEPRRVRRGAEGRQFVARYNYRTVARAELEALETLWK